MLNRWVSTNWATKAAVLLVVFAASSKADTIYSKFTVGDLLSAASTQLGLQTSTTGLYDFWAKPSISGNGITNPGHLPLGAALTASDTQTPMPPAQYPSRPYSTTVPH